MNTDELRALIEQGESQRLEFKASPSERSEILETISAFRNAEGGDVLIGVQDNGALSGQVTIGGNTLEEWDNLIGREVDPAPFPTIEAIEISGKTVIRVNIEPRRVGFVYFARGRAYVRVGRANRAMSATEIRERHREGLEPAVLPEDWSHEENAPAFILRPRMQYNRDDGSSRIEMTIFVTGADVRPRYRWQGKDITNEWLDVVLSSNAERRFQVRPSTPFTPTNAKGVIAFEAAFNWRARECHVLWEMPYHLVARGSHLNIVLDTSLDSLHRPKHWTENLQRTSLSAAHNTSA